MASGRLLCLYQPVRKLGTRQEHEHIFGESGTMKRVVIHELLPGMVLVKPVTNTNGLPIIAVGTILDAAMIERLQRMELTSVYVEGESVDSGGKTLMELEVELDHRFRHVAQDPIQQLILRSLRTHLHASHGTTPTTKGPATA